MVEMAGTSPAVADGLPLAGRREVIKSLLRARHSEGNEGTMASGALGEWGERLGARVGEFSASIHFLTRLPLPRHEGAAGGEFGASRLGVSARGLRGRADRRDRLCAGA